MRRRAGAAEPSAVVPSVGNRMRAMEEGAALSMQFHGASADEAQRWQNEFAAKLRQLLGPYSPPTQWDCTLERRVELPTHVREERVLTADGIAPVPLHLLIPKSTDGAAGKRPAVLALHGHGEFGHDPVAGIDDTPELKQAIKEANYDYGRQLVERGYVVAAPCFTPFGRRLGAGKVKRGDACTLVNMQLSYLGKLLMAENLRDALWTFEFLSRHEAVDAGRTGCVGLSYGGRMTMLTTALEPRIRACVISGAMNCLQERAMNGAISGCQLIPGLLEFGDVPEISGLIAPRPCVWEIGAQDGLIKPEWVDKIAERQGRVYAALAAADAMQIDRHDGGHQWHGDVAFPMLAKALGK
jgi:dienelactone hydrolase